ncbi:LYR motif-containing protein 4-like [Actinia tenebrosa]|uniref:LYR motif-containing protein 4-like n=1 Tax=Actinia tenebrosa TaxID=6105 RepID=A0A6P8INL8_ACTTE|nr:LYR motif-containing protein 4-like [Actinia tenebrosa]
MAARSRVLKLYRQLLREGQKFSDYNYREYALRRTRDGFKSNKDIINTEDIGQLIEKAQMNLEIVKRQATLNAMYKHQKLVVEKQ